MESAGGAGGGPPRARGKTKDVTLRVLDCRQVFTGWSSGRQFTVYEVDAVTRDGLEVKERDGTLAKLRAFERLPKNQLVEVSVTAFNSEQHGRSYTLSRRGKSNEPSTEDRIIGVERELAEMKKRFDSLSRAFATLQEAQAPQPGPSASFDGMPDNDGGAAW